MRAKLYAILQELERGNKSAEHVLHYINEHLSNEERKWTIMMLVAAVCWLVIGAMIGNAVAHAY